MCLPARVGFNMAGSVCSHRWRDFSRPRFTCVLRSRSLALSFAVFEKRKKQMESIFKKKREAKRARKTSGNTPTMNMIDSEEEKKKLPS